MKYCSRCGNALKESQTFCNKCGRRLKNDPKPPSRTARQQQVQSTQYHTPKVKKEKKQSKPFLIVILTLIFILLIAGLVYGGYKLLEGNGISINIGDSDTSTTSDNNSETSNNDETGANNGSSEGQYEKPDIKILSSYFSNEFMHQDRRNGFEGVQIGMSRNNLESRYGKADTTVNIAGVTAEKYGNIAVNYDNDTVKRYFIVPHSVKLQEYENYQGRSTMNAKEGGVVYDDNPANGFTIKVYTNEYNDITGIESVDQIPRAGR
ncbi:zinc ribbon domain-containing protein [Staphylococcus sp. 11262D007BW]